MESYGSFQKKSIIKLLGGDARATHWLKLSLSLCELSFILNMAYQRPLI